jgi:hypothetical protein
MNLRGLAAAVNLPLGYRLRGLRARTAQQNRLTGSGIAHVLIYVLWRYGARPHLFSRFHVVHRVARGRAEFRCFPRGRTPSFGTRRERGSPASRSSIPTGIPCDRATA